MLAEVDGHLVSAGLYTLHIATLEVESVNAIACRLATEVEIPIAAGVQEAIYSLLMMKNSFIAPSINVETPDPSVEGVPLVTKTEERELEHVMSNSFGFGGTNSTLIFSKYHG